MTSEGGLELVQLLIIGAGGAAREVAAFAPECTTVYQPVAFVDHDEAPSIGSVIADLSVLPLADAIAGFPSAQAVIAIGNAAIRRRMAAKLLTIGLKSATLIHRSVLLGARVEIGEGSILSPGTVVTSDVRIGRHVYVNIGCTISHDAILNDFVTISPGASLPGQVKVETGAFVGTGATFVHGRPGYPLRIGRDAIVGAGACVISDVAPTTTVVGVPARPVQREQRRESPGSIEDRSMRKIAIITTSRADYGIYRYVARALMAYDDVSVGFLVSGTHLSKDHGATVSEIEADGVPIWDRIDLHVRSETPQAITRSAALATEGIGDALARHAVDIVVVLGDRLEMLAAAIATVPFRLPIAHIHGGELSFGAIDELVRHAMTKLSHLHFVSTKAYGRRVAQMGEEDWRITVSGAPALDTLRHTELPARDALERRLGRPLGQAPLLVTLHAETASTISVEAQAKMLLTALALARTPIVFTAPNADYGGQIIRRAIEDFVASHENAVLVESLGNAGYFGLMGLAAAMVGNSSSGIIEAASLSLPVVNIGHRQDGRIRAPNVIDCEWDIDDIATAVEKATAAAFASNLPRGINPYGDGYAGERIAKVLASVPLDATLLQKRFVDHVCNSD